METKTFLFGFGIGLILVSTFLFVIYLVDSSGNTDKKRIARMSEHQLVAYADELIKEASSRGIGKDIDVSAITDGLEHKVNDSKMTEQEIINAARDLGMEFPEITVDISEPAVAAVPTETPTPTDTPSPTPSPEPTATPEPTKAPEPTAAPSAEDQGDSIHVSIPMGASSIGVSELLKQAGIVEDAWYFDQYIMKMGKEDSLRYGEYDIPKDSTAAEILAIITSS